MLFDAQSRRRGLSAAGGIGVGHSGVSLGYEQSERCRNSFRLSLDLCWSRPTMPWVSACLITFASTGSAAEAADADIFAEAVKTANATHLLMAWLAHSRAAMRDVRTT